MLGAPALAGGGDTAPEREADARPAELARAERTVRRVENRREVDIDVGTAQREARGSPCSERLRLGRVRGGSPGRRQVEEGAGRAAFLVGEDERPRRPRCVAGRTLDEHAADTRRRGKPGDDDERRLLPRREVGDRGLGAADDDRGDGVQESDAHGAHPSRRVRRNAVCVAGPGCSPSGGVLGRVRTLSGTNAPCVLALERPARPFDERRSVEPS